MEMDETVLPPRPSIKIDLKAIRARLDNPQFYLRSTYLADVRALIAEVERLRGIEKDHLDDWRRIQDAERERDSLKKTHTPEKPRDPFIGYMALEGWTEDENGKPDLKADWDGVITGPHDPTGANLAWQNPIKMIEHSAYNSLIEQLNDLKADHSALQSKLAEKDTELDQAKAEIERLKDTPGGKRIYGALNELEKEREKNRRLREALAEDRERLREALGFYEDGWVERRARIHASGYIEKVWRNKGCDLDHGTKAREALAESDARMKEFEK